MSKMSQLHMELSESASDLGFESIEEAERAGYVADYNTGTMYKPRPLNAWLEERNELTKAHEAWLKERDSVIESIDNAIYHNRNLNNGKHTYEQTVLQRAKEFIKKGEV